MCSAEKLVGYHCLFIILKADITYNPSIVHLYSIFTLMAVQYQIWAQSIYEVTMVLSGGLR